MQNGKKGRSDVHQDDYFQMNPHFSIIQQKTFTASLQGYFFQAADKETNKKKCLALQSLTCAAFTNNSRNKRLVSSQWSKSFPRGYFH